MKAKGLADLQVHCIDCGADFTLTGKEQVFYELNGYKLPKRCKACRKKRREYLNVEERRKFEEVLAKKREAEEMELSNLLRTSVLKQTAFSQIRNASAAKSLVIVGNGFDIMHGAKSSYWDFQKTLGKNSELRFHLENYLCVPPDKLWYNFNRLKEKNNEYRR